jgi:2-polyprenyl-3-methyl-5-hydroxy-6-metoxy-1,4-benzoquinol methylase
VNIPSDPGALRVVANRCGFRSPERLSARCRSVLRGIDLQGKRVLEVGCGNGMFGLWSALHGATFVLGIEPERDGSDTGSLAEFRRTIDRLKLNGVVSARSSYLEDLKPSDGPFDVAILFNVINHLSETAVVRLHEDDAAVDEYVRILSRFRKLLSRDATVVVADCGRRNFWNDVV